MEGYEYAEVALYAYAHLEDLAEGLRSGAETRALLSYRARDALAAMESVAADYAAAEELLSLGEEVERAAARLTEEEKLLLEHKYFRRAEVLARYGERPVFHGTVRHYFRRQRALLEKLALYLGEEGYTEESFFCRFSDYAPFMRAHAALKKGKRGKDGVRRKLDYQKSETSSRGAVFPRSRNTAIPATARHPKEMATMCAAVSPPLS